MIAPPMDPWMDGAGGGGAQAAAAWRERERRQRSVRLLMMFLLMLLLMDGEEHQARQNREGQLRKKKALAKPMDKAVYQARLEQDGRVYKVAKSHVRYQRLVEKNDENVELEVRKWADAQQELEQDTFDSKAEVEEDPENKKTVFHYPWNATGFYRGEWVRQGGVPSEGNEEGDATTEDEKEEEATKEEQVVKEETKEQVMSAVDLEGPMLEILKEKEEPIGVFLLPKGINMEMGNFTATKTETAAAQAAVESLRAQAGRAPGSPFLRLSHPELNIIVEEAEDEDPDATPQVTLTKSTGRAAFQFYSRSVSAMKELSLVDGFVKLYDSKTAGYSTRRDILLRVRGVMIHSIGRLSLVSNAAPGRSAFVIAGKEKKSKKKTADETSTRRRLEEYVEALDGKATVDDQDVESIRDHVLALYPFDAQNNELEMEGGWKMTTLDFDESAFGKEKEGNWLGGTVPAFGRRKLTEEVDIEEALYSAETSVETLATTAETPEAVDAATEDPARTLAKSKPPVKEKSESPPTLIKKSSRVVVPYPFVTDDKQESVRKAKTPLARKMPAREQLLEVNAGRCEFEINLDVSEVEWTLGQWRSMMSKVVHDTNLVDPSMAKKEVDEGDKKRKDKESPRLKRMHPDRVGMDRSKKPSHNQALAMTMLGTIHSPNCDFTSTLNATAIRTDWEYTTAKAINYSFYMMLTCLVQIVVLLRQLLHTQSQSAATRVSLLSVGWQTVVDALVCLAHIYLSLAMQPLFTAFASVAFFKLLIFCVIEMKYMAIIIQARNNTNGGQNTAELLRRQVAMLHLRFYVALVGAFLAFFYAGTEYRTVYILALYSFWVPQIVQNIITEAKRPLHSYYIYGMSLSRLVAPVYVFAVPNNFLKEVYPESPTNLLMCELLVLWVAIQTAVLVAQGKYGARFMIPARFLPPKFDYSRPIPASMLPPEALELSPSDSSFDNERTSEVQTLLTNENAPPERHSTGVTRNRIKGSRSTSRSESMTTEPVQGLTPTLDCVICYNGIDVHNRKGYMLAPCNHIFHKECLVQWMDVKMECPICRTELPSL